MRRITPCLTTALAALLLAAPAWALDLVRDGKPNAVIIIPDTKHRTIGIIEPAARELARHIKLISGADLPVMGEKDGAKADAEVRVYVGESAFTKRRLNIDPNTLPREGFRVVCDDEKKVLAIVGRDYGSSYRRKYDNPSTYYGVAYFLERYLGVRWIMPGDVGIYYEPRATVSVGEIFETKKPYFMMRWIRNADRFLRPDVEEGNLHDLKVDPKAFQARYEDIMQWQRRLRLGWVERTGAGHTMMKLYEKFWPDHPECFAMQLDGTRRVPNTRTFKLCISNPLVIDAVTEMAEEELAAGKSVANLGFNDSNGWCFCPKCKALDPPNPRHTRKYPTGLVDGPEEIEYAWMTDRYLTLWNEVARRLEKKYPDALFAIMKYGATSDAPERERYHPKLFMAAVTMNSGRGPFDGEWWPRGMDDMFDVGVHSFYWRPNLMWNNHYGMPYVPVSKFARAVHYFTINGMKGFDHDSWTNHFGPSGALVYAAGRLSSSPWLDGAYLLDEYAHKGFGKAGDAILEYLRLCDTACYAEGSYDADKHTFFDLGQRVFTPELVAKLHTLARQAAADSEGDAEQFRARTEIFLKGHEFTMLQAGVLAAISAKGLTTEAYYDGIYDAVKAREEFINTLGLNWAVNAVKLRADNVSGSRADITRYDVYWKTKNAHLPAGVPACMALKGAGRPVLTAAEKTITVDGDAADWKGVAFSERFKDYRSMLPGGVLTKAAVAYDDKALYMCVQTDEPFGLVKQPAERDTATLFANDAIEIFIDPERDCESYFHLVADFLGQQYDGSGALLKKTYSSEWNGKWTVAVKQTGEKTWTFEFAIPFADLGRKAPAVGERWRLNINRTRKEMKDGRKKKPKDYLSIAPTMGSFHDIAMGAGLVFGKPTPAPNLLAALPKTDGGAATIPLPPVPTRMYRLGVSGQWKGALESTVVAVDAKGARVPDRKPISVRTFGPGRPAAHFFLVPEDVEHAAVLLKATEGTMQLADVELAEYELTGPQ